MLTGRPGGEERLPGMPQLSLKVSVKWPMPAAHYNREELAVAERLDVSLPRLQCFFSRSIQTGPPVVADMKNNSADVTIPARHEERVEEEIPLLSLLLYGWKSNERNQRALSFVASARIPLCSVSKDAFVVDGLGQDGTALCTLSISGVDVSLCQALHAERWRGRREDPLASLAALKSAITETLGPVATLQGPKHMAHIKASAAEPSGVGRVPFWLPFWESPVCDSPDATAEWVNAIAQFIDESWLHTDGSAEMEDELMAQVVQFFPRRAPYVLDRKLDEEGRMINGDFYCPIDSLPCEWRWKGGDCEDMSICMARIFACVRSIDPAGNECASRPFAKRVATAAARFYVFGLTNTVLRVHTVRHSTPASEDASTDTLARFQLHWTIVLMPRDTFHLLCTGQTDSARAALARRSSRHSTLLLESTDGCLSVVHPPPNSRLEALNKASLAFVLEVTSTAAKNPEERPICDVFSVKFPYAGFEKQEYYRLSFALASPEVNGLEHPLWTFNKRGAEPGYIFTRSLLSEGASAMADTQIVPCCSGRVSISEDGHAAIRSFNNTFVPRIAPLCPGTVTVKSEEGKDRPSPKGISLPVTWVCPQSGPMSTPGSDTETIVQLVTKYSRGLSCTKAWEVATSCDPGSSARFVVCQW